jgi:pimeloyl-ACP methyl ester carboxylesterase
MKILRLLGVLIIFFIGLYFIGPRPSAPAFSNKLPLIPDNADSLDKFILQKEKKFPVKPDNEARIVWLDSSSKEKTDFSVVYLHGFSASQEEGNPVHRWFAKRFGCNLFLSRLYAHGIDTRQPLKNYTAEESWNSAKEAYMIGRKLGRKVILMATSTGGTLALRLASEYPDIAALILLSPNIEINDPNAWLLNNHWGLQIARMIKGNYIVANDTSSLYAKYWNNKYCIESTVQLEELLETTMKESTFKKIRQPVLLLYYYQDEKHQDPVVKVSAMKRMFDQLGTPDSLKYQAAVPYAGNHVIGSWIKSKAIPQVEKDCEQFAIKILGLQ